jgi:hypothetical protein
MPVHLKNLESFLNSLLEINQEEIPQVPPVVEKPAEKPQERPKRCQHSDCKTKLVLSDFACQCKQFYCMKHRYAEAHSCAFDYRAAASKTLEKQNVKIIGDSFERI